MASVEISFLTGFKSLIVIYFPPFLHCIFSPLCNCRDIVVVLIRRIIIVESLPELLHAVAASASVWGAGSLQVLELTPASPVSTCTRWPPSLRSAVLRNPRVYCTGPPSMTPSELTRILLLLVWMDPSTLGLGSPQHFTQGHLERPESQLLPLSVPGSHLDLPKKSLP